MGGRISPPLHAPRFRQPWVVWCRRTVLPGISSCEWHNLQIEFSPPQQLLFPVKFLKILRLACLKRVCKIEEVNLFCKRFIDSPFPQFNFEKLRPNKDQIVGKIIQRKEKNQFRFMVHRSNTIGCFCPYVGQPHNHIGWATLMPFASINPTNLICEIFAKIFWELVIL